MVGAVGVVGSTAFGLWLDRQGLSGATLLAVMVVCAAIVVVATVYAGKSDERQTAARKITWRELEERFQRLLMRNGQEGDPVHAFESEGHEPGNHWYIGGGKRATAAEAIDLCSIAGHKLKADGLATSARLQRIENDADRWLWYLVEIGETAAEERWTASSGGQPDRHIYHFRFLLQACVNGCRKLLVNEV